MSYIRIMIGTLKVLFVYVLLICNIGADVINVTDD